MPVSRLDRGTLEKPKRLRNGWLKVDAFLTRSGVFSYQVDSKVFREYRPPDEVFKADSLETLCLLPVTDEHPPAFLTAENTAKHSRGSTGEKATQDGMKLRSSLMIHDSTLAAKLEKGEAREVSCGYTCDLEFEAGTSPDGEQYDAVQRNISYNHVAIVAQGRAGPEVRVRMDAQELGVLLFSQDGTTSKQEHPVHKIRIDGIEFDVSSAQAVQAFEKNEKKNADALAAVQAEAVAAKKSADQAQAKADASADETKKLKADLAEAPAKLKVELKARAALEAKAHKTLGPKAKLDAMSTKEVHEAVLKKLSPDTKLEGKSDAYVEARFDAAFEAFEASTEDDDTSNKRSKKDTSRDTEDVADDEREDDEEEPLDADASRAKMMKHNANLWKHEKSA